jgi:hypothetical protein
MWTITNRDGNTHNFTVLAQAIDFVCSQRRGAVISVTRGDGSDGWEDVFGG